MKNIILTIILLLLVACSTSEEYITVGFIGPLTGDVAIFGEVEKNAAEIAIEEINSAGGVNGKKLKIIYEDGKCSGKEAASAAQKLINIDKVKILFITCVAENLAVAPIAEENNVLQITAWAYHPDITPLDIFRLSISDVTTAQIMAETIFKKAKKVGVLYEVADYPVGLMNAFTPYFKALGGEIIEESVKTDTTDVRSHLTKLLAEKPGAIWLNPDFLNLGINMLKQLKELGYEGPLYGNFFGGSDIVQNRSDSQGMIFPADPIVQNSDKKTKLFETYKEKYGAYPAFDFPTASQYDAVYMLKEAIEKVGEDPEKIKEYLHTIEFKGVLGTYRFDENGDAIGMIPSIKQIKEGKAVNYKD